MRPPVKFNYQLTGPADAPWLLLLHGFMGALGEWDATVAALQDRYRCLAVDLPGHGETPCPERPGVGLGATAIGLLALTQELGAPAFTVVGYSLGARVGLYLASHFPEQCQAAILESGSPGLLTEEERLRRRQSDGALARRLETGDFDEFLRAWYAQELFASLAARPELLAQVIAQRRQNRPERLAWSLRALGAGVQAPMWRVLPRLRVPLHQIVGMADRKYVGIAKAVCDCCPRATMVAMRDSGHAVHVEDSAGFIKEVTETLARFAHEAGAVVP